jgi:hypothetical protein
MKLRYRKDHRVTMDCGDVKDGEFVALEGFTIRPADWEEVPVKKTVSLLVTVGADREFCQGCDHFGYADHPLGSLCTLFSGCFLEKKNGQHLRCQPCLDAEAKVRDDIPPEESAKEVLVPPEGAVQWVVGWGPLDTTRGECAPIERWLQSSLYDLTGKHWRISRFSRGGGCHPKVLYASCGQAEFAFCEDEPRSYDALKARVRLTGYADKPSCKACRHAWWAKGRPCDTNKPTLENGGLGECRHRSPAFSASGQERWPVVAPGDFCWSFE